MPAQIYGSPKLKLRLRELLKKYLNIFSRHVRSGAATLTPFKFEVDLES